MIVKKKKVLILYAPFGAGHGGVAKALTKAFLFKYPDVEVINENILEFTFSAIKGDLPKIYDKITLKFPILYKWLYNYFQPRIRILNWASGVILKKNKFVNFIKDVNPNFILATNPLPIQLISETKEKNIIDILSGNVCTDFGFHSMWYNRHANYYFVATEEVKNSLIRHGVKSEEILVTGIPTDIKFTKQPNRQKIIKDLGFNSSGQILLIVGGKISCKDILLITKKTKEKNERLQFIIVAGRDVSLYRELSRSQFVKSPFIKVFSFVNNLDEYMTVSDLIITKAGGLTVSECLIKGLPMVINDIIPGQEEDNVNYVVENKIGLRTTNLTETIDILNELFSNPSKLETMKKDCQRLAKPRAAEEVIDFVVSKIKEMP